MEELIKALTMIKSECDKRTVVCGNCPLNKDFECLFEIMPCCWDIEDMEQALAKMKEGVMDV